MKAGEIKLNLVAGIRKEVNDFFLSVKKEIDPKGNGIKIIYSEKLSDYFDLSYNFV